MGSVMKKAINKARNASSKLERVAGDATDKEKRKAEEQLLKPVPLDPFNDHDTKYRLPQHRNELESRSVLIVFRDTAQMELVGNLFHIRHQKNSSNIYITDISLLETIAKNVRDGSMKIVDNQIVLVEQEGQTEKNETPDPDSVIAEPSTIEKSLGSNQGVMVESSEVEEIVDTGITEPLVIRRKSKTDNGKKGVSFFKRMTKKLNK